MRSRTSLEVLLAILSDPDNKADRLGLAHLNVEQRQAFGDAYRATTRLLPSDAVDSETSFFLAVRVLWSLVPAELFNSINPNFERMASNSLRELGIDDELAAIRLSKVFRRLREARRSGRPPTRLDFDRAQHANIFESQNRRCALCGYHFVADDFIYALDDDDEVYVADHLAYPGEVVLEKYYRRPVLDHIIPYFLGGDRPENWQILCQSCNLGKGASLSWLSRRGWTPASRVADLFQLTAGLRYSVLANYVGQRSETHLPSIEYRLFKKNPERLLFFDNLECREVEMEPEGPAHSMSDCTLEGLA